MATILLIDDDEELRSVTAEVIRRGGHTVVEADNGEEGLRLFKQIKADLVVTDIVMPEKEGLEVLMELRKKQPALRIVAMSGGGMESKPGQFLYMAKLLGADKVLAKPFSNEALINAINELLA